MARRAIACTICLAYCLVVSAQSSSSGAAVVPASSSATGGQVSIISGAAPPAFTQTVTGLLPVRFLGRRDCPVRGADGCTGALLCIRLQLARRGDSRPRVSSARLLLQPCVRCFSLCLACPQVARVVTMEPLSTREAICTQQTTYCQTAGCDQNGQNITTNFCNPTTMGFQCSCSAGESKCVRCLMTLKPNRLTPAQTTAVYHACQYIRLQAESEDVQHRLSEVCPPPAHCHSLSSDIDVQPLRYASGRKCQSMSKRLQQPHLRHLWDALADLGQLQGAPSLPSSLMTATNISTGRWP